MAPPSRVGLSLLAPVSLACMYVVYLDPDLPLSWFLLVPAVWAGVMLSPYGAAIHALMQSLAAAVLAFTEADRFSYVGFLPSSLIVDLLLVASTFITLQVALLRDERERALAAERALRREADAQSMLLGQVFDSMTDGMMLFTDGALVRHNPAARHLLGRPLPRRPQEGWATYLGLGAPNGTPLSEPEFPGTKGQRRLTTTVTIDHAAHRRLLEIGSWPISEDKDDILVLVTDVTNQRHRLAELSRFAGIVSHDLRTPLSSLHGWLELATDAAADGEDVRPLLERAAASSDRMERVIGGWINYTVVREGGLSPEPVALDDVVTDIVGATSNAPAETDPQIHVAAPHVVHTDRALTRQLLANLVGNAVKFARPGSAARDRDQLAPGRGDGLDQGRGGRSGSRPPRRRGGAHLRGVPPCSRARRGSRGHRAGVVPVPHDRRSPRREHRRLHQRARWRDLHDDPPGSRHRLRSRGQRRTSTRGVASSRVGRAADERRWMFCSRPTASMPANIELPPYDTKGSGTPVTGMMPRHMPMFWKAWKPNQQAMPAAAMRPNTSSVRAAIASARQSTMPSSAMIRPAPTRPSSSPATVKTKSVCCSGTKPDAGLRAVEEALAEEPAVADRDPRLLDVVAGAARVEVGVGEGEEPVDLVVLQEARRRPRRAAPPMPATARPTSHQREARTTASTPKTVAESTSIVPRSGWSMISAAGTPAMSSIASTSTVPTRRASDPRSARRRPGPCRSRRRAWRTPTAGSTARRA